MNQIDPEHDYLQLFRQVMREAGSASQTFAALLRMAGEKRGYTTFASLGVLAKLSWQEERTVRRQLKTLIELGFVERKGRGRLGINTNRKRRTVTYALTRKAMEIVTSDKFTLLPRWAAWRLPTFAQRAVYASICSRIKLVEKFSESGCVEERLAISLRELENETGLTRETVAIARRELIELGVVYQEDGGLLLSNNGEPPPEYFEPEDQTADVEDCDESTDEERHATVADPSRRQDEPHKRSA